MIHVEVKKYLKTNFFQFNYCRCQGFTFKTFKVSMDNTKKRVVIRCLKIFLIMMELYLEDLNRDDTDYLENFIAPKLQSYEDRLTDLLDDHYDIIIDTYSEFMKLHFFFKICKAQFN